MVAASLGPASSFGLDESEIESTLAPSAVSGQVYMDSCGGETFPGDAFYSARGMVLDRENYPGTIDCARNLM